LKIEIEKASGKAICRYTSCASNPDYIKDGRIIKGTDCARIIMFTAAGGASAFYCRDCLDKILFDVKIALNSKLWAFK
jgi:hypothetical protein